MEYVDDVTIRILGTEHPMFKPTSALIIHTSGQEDDSFDEQALREAMLSVLNERKENYDLSIRQVEGNWGADASAIEIVLVVTAEFLMAASAGLLVEAIKEFVSYRDQAPAEDLEVWVKSKIIQAFELPRSSHDSLQVSSQEATGSQITLTLTDTASGWTYTVPLTPMQREGRIPVRILRAHESGSTQIEQPWMRDD